MKLAAIDIGSNAIRFQITSILDKGKHTLFKKMEYIRFPLRLGHDVFTHGEISGQSADKFVKLMKTYKLLLELYEADDHMFCATSAMRESKNGMDLVARVQEEVGVTINVIDGQTEAELINKAIYPYLINNETYLHIDVGGGSTEFNLYVKGKKITNRSFRIGSVRILEQFDSSIAWTEMEGWLKEHIKKKYGKVIAVGTGGNISKLYELAHLSGGKKISLNRMRKIRDMISELSMDQRIYDLQMNPDRADVIVPASNIYIKAMEWSYSTNMIVPEVGLKDGIIFHLFEKNTKTTKIKFVNTQDQSMGKKIIEI